MPIYMPSYTYRYIKGYIGRSSREIECILKGCKGRKGSGRWQAPHHPATAQTPKGKRVTGKMPGTAVRNNIYRRGDFVTWQVLRGDYIIRHTVLTLYLYGGLEKYSIFNIISILNTCSVSLSIWPYVDIEYWLKHWPHRLPNFLGVSADDAFLPLRKRNPRQV